MPAKKRVLKPLFSITNMGLRIGDLEAMVKLGSSFSAWARDLTESNGFVISKEEKVKFVVLTPRDLGFKEWPTTDEILDTNRLKTWSLKRLKDQAIELCACDDAHYLRAHYAHQPHKESLAVAMRPLVINKKGDVAVFHIDHYPRGLWLYARFAMPTSRHDLDDKWVFRLVKRSSKPST